MIEGQAGLRSRTLAIWAVAVLASVWLALTAAGAVTQENAPRVALMLYPKNGFAYQNNALESSAGNGASVREMRVQPNTLFEAREALRREPLAGGALTLIGLDREAAGQHGEAARAIVAAHELNKRDLVANAWLIHHYGSLPGDHFSEVLALVDEALKIRPQLGQQYMPAFAQALTNSDTIPVFMRLLRVKPSWELNFWNAVAASDAALPNGEVLRSRLLAGSGQLTEIDTLLLAAYIRARRMDLALTYAKRLPLIADDQGNLLRNASFGKMPAMAPLDWELMGDGRIVSSIDEGAGTLIVNAIAGSSGTVARQLVALPPGGYVLLLKLGRVEFVRGSDISVRIHCAESDDPNIPSLSERAQGDIDRPFAVAEDSRCRFYWVDVIFSAIDAAEPASTNIAEVRVVRARARQETEAPAEKTDGKEPQ